jgi:hypothetical protein
MPPLFACFCRACCVPLSLVSVDCFLAIIVGLDIGKHNLVTLLIKTHEKSESIDEFISHVDLDLTHAQPLSMICFKWGTVLDWTYLKEKTALLYYWAQPQEPAHHFELSSTSSSKYRQLTWRWEVIPAWTETTDSHDDCRASSWWPCDPKRLAYKLQALYAHASIQA